jgi:cell division protein FtsB
MACPKARTSAKKEIYYIVCIVAVLLILGFSVFGPGGYRFLRKSQLELQEQHIRVDRLERENHKRMKPIEKLRSDDSTLENRARDSGYGKQGEIIYQLPQKQEEPRESKPTNSK